MRGNRERNNYPSGENYEIMKQSKINNGSEERADGHQETGVLRTEINVIDVEATDGCTVQAHRYDNDNVC